jgi:hypothetical protein
MKGFATSLAIVLSFCAGIILFNFQVTTSFIVGTIIVVGATYLYNAPDHREHSRPRTNSYVLSSTSPPTTPRHFIPAVNTSPTSRIYPHYSHTPSQSQSALAALRSQPFPASPPTYRRSGNGLSLSGSQTPDHIVGFPQGILDGQQQQSFTMGAAVNGPGPSGLAKLPEVKDDIESGGLHLDMKHVGLAAWVPYSSTSGADKGGGLSLAQRRGLNDFSDSWESPLTP